MRRNWTAIGIGLEVLAGVVVTIDPILAIPVAVAGGTAILWGLFPDQLNRLSSQLFRRKTKQFVPPPDIARRIYEETSDTFDGAFEGYSSESPDDVLNSYGSGCIQNGLPIFGKRPPSERLEEIPEARNLRVRNGARELWGSNPSRPAWESLHARQADVTRLWKSLIDDYHNEDVATSPNTKGPNND